MDEQATQRLGLVRTLSCVCKALCKNATLAGSVLVWRSINKCLEYAQEPKGQTSIQQLAKYFHLPINVAGSRLGICPTVLKKICRKHGLSRWPHRKVGYTRKGLGTLLRCCTAACRTLCRLGHKKLWTCTGKGAATSCILKVAQGHVGGHASLLDSDYTFKCYLHPAIQLRCMVMCWR